MAQPKADVVVVPPAAMPEPDIAAELDALAARSSPSPTTTRGAAPVAARPPLVVVGHRGSGMNAPAAPPEDPRARGGDVRENTLRSFNAAAAGGVAYVEFDVQVTKDGCPVIFHDNFIYTEENFLSYGPQRNPDKAGKPLLRKLKDGRILRWEARSEDALCTLREAFEGVDRRVGFNVELKFDDDLAYTEAALAAALRAVLEVVFEHAGGRPVIFSSFQPDAAQFVRKLQDKYPVYFLTNGGTQMYADPRRNSLEEAVRLCVAAGLQGIVSEVRAILRRPAAVAEIKEAKLSLMTYGQLNNVLEVVYVQHLMGVDGVIVDRVREIAEAVSAFPAAAGESGSSEGGGRCERLGAAAGTPSFSTPEMSFLLRLIPELVQ
ncbi:hypothetical protein PVAP13_7NG144117 [Panicum virgatum]|uniref:glycerophosphodiester phosphodiesterase n=1 Tax=Panicum virgatum TaxID=38727 RepID=A0A8T0PXI4_PANVG|nr:hypothetical protein PVAP13_7NG144117 [Panicum virgatum]